MSIYDENHVADHYKVERRYSLKLRKEFMVQSVSSTLLLIVFKATSSLVVRLLLMIDIHTMYH